MRKYKFSLSLSIIFSANTVFDSLEYLPLYRIKGNMMRCDSCNLRLDFTVGHFFVFYILEKDDKIAIIFEYRNASVMQKGLSISKMPSFKIGSASMTLNLLVKFLTRDNVQVLQHDHRHLLIKADNGVKRKVLNWWRKNRGHVTKKSELNESKLLTKLRSNDELPLDKHGDGVYCTRCMKKRSKQHFQNAYLQFFHFAEFAELNVD